MIWFTRKQKKMARNNTISYLSSKYYDSELKLDKAARRGDLKAVDRAMDD